MNEPMKEMFSRSRLVVLDFKHIKNSFDPVENISIFFDELESSGKNPRLPENRQIFNNRLIYKSGYRYLVGQYGEDRSSMLAGSDFENEGRFIHLGADIFCKNLEDVFAPCDGQIVSIGNEEEDHSFGHYLIIKPDDASIPYVFYGHLGDNIHPKGRVVAGEKVANLGDLVNHQNGGWSRHLHLQMLKQLPDNEAAPLGYADLKKFESLKDIYPSPYKYFPQWKIDGLNSL